MTVVQTPTASLVMIVVITISKYDDEQTPTASLLVMMVVTISNGGDVDTTDRARGSNADDHYQAIWR
jgi:hypothetical protein